MQRYVQARHFKRSSSVTLKYVVYKALYKRSVSLLVHSDEYRTYYLSKSNPSYADACS